MRFLLAALLAIPLVARPASAGAVFKSGTTPAHFLEVYTSEGCSSCPPAEAWLGVLKTDSDLWKTFVPVAWHVDYWDRLGWTDVVGSRNSSIRQKAEAGQAHASSYTPGFFLNGAEWRGWFDGNAMPPADRAPTGTLKATQTAPREFVVEYVPVGPDTPELEIGGALLAMGVTVDIKAGENRNKTLTHDFAALASASRRVKMEGGKYTARFTFYPTADVTPEGWAAAFWVAPAGSYKTLQATGGFLP